MRKRLIMSWATAATTATTTAAAVIVLEATLARIRDV
jgi:hypothetical protein